MLQGRIERDGRTLQCVLGDQRLPSLARTAWVPRSTPTPAPMSPWGCGPSTSAIPPKARLIVRAFAAR